MKGTIQRQSVRRMLVIACYAMCGFLLGVVWAAENSSLDRGILVGGLLVAGVGVAASMSWISHATRDYASEIGQGQADERQSAVRDAAYRTAYTVLFGSMMLGLVYFSMATSKRLGPHLWMPAEEWQWRILAYLLVFAGATLPHALIIWREPDLPEESTLEHPA